ncbi:MAG: CAP domain-containing protein [Bacteroidia bacterium]|nr:CAP domain-containing protein [Bacteroidia bacterium]MCC7532769.1 CAP domain-containing protein [Bacteroidia bacterium]
MKKITFSGIVLILLTLFLVTCKKEETTPDDGNKEAREQAVKNYNELYLASAVASYNWDGNTSTCNPGTVTQDVYDKVLLRVKYFRATAGLSNAMLTMDADLSAKCQQQALMTLANNNKLSHTPDSTWKCYTADGALAAAKSNIAYGRQNVENIDLFIEDPGTGNEKVGHRRWILFSNASKLGFGCTQSSAALWVINSVSNWNLPAGTPDFIAWPAKGFIPKQVVYPRWSFAVPVNKYPFQVDFSNAVVSMSDQSGNSISLNIIYRTAISSGYVGDNTIVWEPSGINLTSNSDVKYTVNISGVKVNGESKNYSYDVNIINP